MSCEVPTRRRRLLAASWSFLGSCLRISKLSVAWHFICHDGIIMRQRRIILHCQSVWLKLGWEPLPGLCAVLRRTFLHSVETMQAASTLLDTQAPGGKVLIFANQLDDVCVCRPMVHDDDGVEETEILADADFEEARECHATQNPRDSNHGIMHTACRWRGTSSVLTL